MSSSQKPYLINALYEWCEDNGFTPHVVINVDKNTIVPMNYVEDNQLVLNIASNATKNLDIDKEWITFMATFGGVIYDIAIPITNIIAIFAKENGQGMQFETETYNPSPTKKNNTNGLHLVK